MVLNCFSKIANDWFSVGNVTCIGRSQFYECYKAIFYCQANSQPSGWDEDWNHNRPVYWGCKTVNVIANNDQFGTVNGGGLFPADTTIEITATAKESYKFVNWSNGQSTTTIKIKVVADTIFTAIFEKEETEGYITFDEKYYCHVSNDTTILISYMGSDVEVIIPDYISIIADSAFRGNTRLETVTIPNTVQIVGNNAFEGCTNLKTVKIEDPVYVIGKNAFKGCVNAVIYCESSGPYRWDFYWNPDQRPVKWNYRFDKPNETANKMNMNIFAHHNIIVVENAETDIYVYDVAGNCIEHMEPCQSAEITMQHNGIYLVKIGSTTKRVAITM